MIETWRGQANGVFEHQVVFDAAVSAVSNAPLAVTDWNGDGILDLLYGPGNVHSRLGCGDGSFNAEETCALGMGS